MDQQPPRRPDIDASADEVEVPERILGIADHHATREPPPLEDELAVTARMAVVEDGRIAPLPLHEGAGREDRQSGDFQVGGEPHAGESGLLAGEPPRQHLRLRMGRLDETVGDAAMFRAFADRMEAGQARRELIVDDHAASDREAGGPREIRIWPHADGGNDEIGRDRSAVSESKPDRVTLPRDRHGLAVEQNLYALARQSLRHEDSCPRVELPLHQAIHDMHERDIRPAPRQPIGGLDAEQPAADDGDPPSLGRGLVHRCHVWPVPEGDHARLVHALNRKPDRMGARSENAAIEGDPLAPGERCRASLRIERDHGISGDEPDAVLLVPAARPQEDILSRRIARQQRRQQHPVVGRTRFRAHDRDGKASRIERQETFEETHARHAVADDEQPLALSPSIHGSGRDRRRLVARVEELQHGRAAARVCRIIDEVEPTARSRKLDVENLADRGGRSVRHHHDPVGEQHGLVHIMRDHDRRVAEPGMDLHDGILKMRPR